MSLYADEDIELYGSAPGAGAVVAPTDPLQALTAALSTPAETPEQADALQAAGTRFEEHADRLPDLLTKLLPMVVDGGDSLLRTWTLDMLALTVGRSTLQTHLKLEVAQTSLESLNRLLQTGSISTIRATIPIFSTIYPMVFRHLAIAGNAAAPMFNAFESSKARILSLVLDPSAHPQNVGVKAAAWKFVQKVLIVGTRPTGSDPRLAARSSDVSVALIQPGSLLNTAKVEEEAHMLRTQLITQLYALDDPAVLHPIINSLPLLVKQRPALAPLIVSSIASWVPTVMESARRPSMQVRAVEKSLRAVMAHIARHHGVGYSAQLQDALSRQKQRMEQAWTDDSENRRARRAYIAAGKHLLDDAESSSSANKRARLEVKPGTGDGRSGVVVDVSQFALEPVIDAVIAGLSAASDDLLSRAFENARQAITNNAPDAMQVLAPSLFPPDQVKQELEDEVLNPLDMDLDDEELLMEPLEQELDEPVMIADFRLPPPQALPEEDKNGIVDIAVQRIWDNGTELSHLADLKLSDAPRTAVQPKEMWMLLLARMSSRGGEDKRQVIGEFVAKDFAQRSKFAAVWLNEEWLAKRRGEKSQYEDGLMAILRAYIPTLDSKDSSLSKFLIGLPEIPESVIAALEPLCEDSDRMIVGFLSLRELAEARPPIRKRAVHTLLEFCTHPERKVRVMAITTVRRWVPNTPMSQDVIDYALGVLRRLTIPPKPKAEGDEEAKEGEEGAKVETEEVSAVVKPGGEAAPAAAMEVEGGDKDQYAESRYLADVEVDPTTVSQHVELAFALSRRDQELLDKIFGIYPQLPPAIQTTVEEMLVPLVRSLGPTPKLLEILRNSPLGAEKLALRVITTLSAEGSSPVLVNVIRSLMEERTLDPRFIIPVIGELNKAEIESQVPSIVSLLGQPENRDVVRTAFASALQKMTPADLLVSLHSEKAGLKPTVDAIGICFSMTTVFRSDVLANAMQRIVDQPTPLPVCFVRTVIQAVTTYKSLVPFVANNVIPKLVAKRLWETPQLWDGFVRLVRVLGQASFNALLQMPVERIREVVEKQPTLKGPLKTFLANKPAARQQLAQIFTDDSGKGGAAPTTAPVSASA